MARLVPRRRPLSGIQPRALLIGLAAGLLPLAGLQLALSVVVSHSLPAGAKASDYPTLLLAIGMARFVAMAIGAYAAARATLDSSPLRHAVLAACLLTFVAMGVRLVRPLDVAPLLDLLLAIAVAAGAGVWGARAAARRGALS